MKLYGFMSAVVIGFGLWANILFAQEILKQNNTSHLNDPLSWVGNAVPNNGNVAHWNNIVSGSQSVDMGGNLTWDGVNPSFAAG